MLSALEAKNTLTVPPSALKKDGFLTVAEILYHFPAYIFYLKTEVRV